MAPVNPLGSMARSLFLPGRDVWWNRWVELGLTWLSSQAFAPQQGLLFPKLFLSITFEGSAPGVFEKDW